MRITDSGVGRPSRSATVAPTAKGNVIALPSPYAKNSLAAEKTTSSGRSLRTPSPYNRAVCARSCCRCIAPFRRPGGPARIEPESDVVGGGRGGIEAGRGGGEQIVELLPL